MRVRRRQLGNIDRVRTIYEKQLESFPANCRAWTSFAELEQSLGELDRARAIFELGIAQPLLDMPEVGGEGVLGGGFRT